MLTKFSQWLAKIIADKAERSDVDYIRFGIEVFISTLSKLLFFVVLSYILNIFIELFLILAVFATFRIFSGGVHMSTYTRCLITSSIMFVLPAYLLKNTSITLNPTYLDILTFIFAYLIIYAYVPVSPANHTIPRERHLFLKRTSFIFVSSWFLLAMYVNFYMPKYDYISIYTAIGMLLQAITLTPLGYNFLTSIDLRIRTKEEEVRASEKSI